MNLFETVKASVSVPEAARAYGLTVTRHNMAGVPSTMTAIQALSSIPGMAHGRPQDR